MSIIQSLKPALRICCFMWYDSKMEAYGDVNFKISKMYCDKYGYDIKKTSQRKFLDRTPHWERLPFILRFLEDYDYVVWLDADAHFNVDSPPLTNLIEAYPDKLFILSGDIDDPPYDRHAVINSGFFIAKNTLATKHIFYEWAYSEKLYNTRYGFVVGKDKGLFQDQGVLRLMVDKNLFGMKEHSVVIDYGILQFFPGVNPVVFPNAKLVCEPTLFGLNKKTFVCHWTKFNGADRLKHSLEYYNSVITPNMKKIDQQEQKEKEG